MMMTITMRMRIDGDDDDDDEYDDDDDDGGDDASNGRLPQGNLTLQADIEATIGQCIQLTLHEFNHFF